MHCITFAFSQCFMHYSWNLCAIRIGLGWTHDVIFFAHNMLMHISCIHTFYFPFLGYTLWWYFSACFSLSIFLSLIICTWHPSANPLRLRTLFILGHLLLILIHFTFGFVIRRPKKTSWRTSPNVVFIRRAAWFYRIFPILFYALLFTVEDGISMWDTRELSHLDHLGVLLQHARFWYLYTSVCYVHSRYTYCSHSGHRFRDTTRSEGIASWLPRLSTSEDCAQRWTFVSFLWDTFFMGWSSKHLMLRLCKRSKVPNYGDDF